MNSGSAYDPIANTWLGVSTTEAPTARDDHTAVWTGSRMVVWGGYDGRYTGKTSTGGTYDPATDAWTTMAVDGAPTARGFHTAVWGGDRVVVWGGLDDAGPGSQTGGAYDPATNSWTALPLLSAPSSRYGHRAVWTGRHMVIWGGLTGEGPDTVRLSSGGLYNPRADRVFYAYRRP